MPTLAELRMIGRGSKGARKNFTCDQFAADFQEILTARKISFTPRVMGFKRTVKDSYLAEQALMSGRVRIGSRKNGIGVTFGIYKDGVKVAPKIVLNEPSHPFHKKVIGNETHFWTEVTLDNGKTYCFDNHHPQGCPIEIYYPSFQFTLETVLPTETVEENQAVVFGDEAHFYKKHEDVLADHHLVIKDMPAAEYRSPIDSVINIYQWTTRPDRHLTKYEHHFFDEAFMGGEKENTPTNVKFMARL